jgi:hypothetical protein
MSIWSGIAAAGVGIAFVLVAIGMPVWEWRSDDPRALEEWSYRAFGAHHRLFNKTTNQTEESRDYNYTQLAARQPSMAKAFGDFGQFLVLGIIAGIAGLVLSVVSRWKKLRGIFAGVAFLAAAATILFASFSLVFAIPEAARRDLNPNIAEFGGQLIGAGSLMTWNIAAGWFLPIGSGLAFAWASSDVWHLRSSGKGLPMKVDVTLNRLPAATPPALPPPPIEVTSVVVREPSIEEVFVIGSNGLLIKHMSRSLMTDKDRDVVGSMISAISSFVREAFTERDGEVHEVSLGDHHFVMCSDGGVVVAVLVTVGDTAEIVPRLRHLLAVLRDRYADRLNRWQGEPLEGIEDELGVLWEPYHLPPPPTE